MNTSRKKKIEENTQEAIDRISKGGKGGKAAQIVQNQTGDVINNNIITGENDSDCHEEIQKLKTEIKYLKRIIESKDETIDAYIKLLDKE